MYNAVTVSSSLFFLYGHINVDCELNVVFEFEGFPSILHCALSNVGPGVYDKIAAFASHPDKWLPSCGMYHITRDKLGVG